MFGNVVYNLWFHPLRQYPGSKFDAATRLPYTFRLLRGSITPRTKELHDKYGHVVRIAPNVLSYTCGEAWNGKPLAKDCTDHLKLFLIELHP